MRMIAIAAFAAMTTTTCLTVVGTPALADTKGCSYFVPNNWRAITPVPSSWTLNNCADMARFVGATGFQAFCLMDNPNPNETNIRFSAAVPWTGNPGPTNIPNPNTCDWTL
jgi:hypothetical protein